MNALRGDVDMVTRYGNEQPEPHEHHEGPCRDSALEPEPGYWARWWAEFTRLFSLFWNDGYTKEVVIGSTVVVTVTILGSLLFGWE